ncbi:hypothetical protein F8C76_11280 [Flagellimonas olearia]|uniref:Uncharacterized protein n=1 Tax=Flagellimonas olearia TaxID=552546 RepID=A0A6I1DUH9_9FLAO|nr:hypothetical protein [Allomuricauda olearia]KAB7528438.1 hypothetical protein F8C76_11280 [Allomuricauda olearia]
MRNGKRKMIRIADLRQQKRETIKLDLLRHKKNTKGITPSEMADLFDLSMRYPDHRRKAILAKKQSEWHQKKERANQQEKEMDKNTYMKIAS